MPLKPCPFTLSLAKHDRLLNVSTHFAIHPESFDFAQDGRIKG